MTPIYRWNGQYFGFIKNDRLFNASSQYLGWVTEDGRVWRRNGTFLGEVENENYILRRTSMATPANRAVRATPATPVTPARRANREGKALRAGRIDALDEFAST
ncbi:TPA: 4-fold beta flower protein [Vibrio parahaemolyticus]